MTRRWKRNPVNIDDLIHMYTVEKLTPQEIAEKVGYKRAESVADKLRRAGVLENGKIDTGKIKALHRAGWTVEAIAIDTEVSEETVRNVIGG